MSSGYLADGLPRPAPMVDGLDTPFWEGLAAGEIRLQHCGNCSAWQWGPEWICHKCHSHDVAFERVEPSGRIYSYERVWHPVHPALKDQGPYIVVLVEIPHADNVRMVGNLLGDPHQQVEYGAEVRAVFENHTDGDAKWTLLQWEIA